jgi:hypothetical protein
MPNPFPSMIPTAIIAEPGVSLNAGKVWGTDAASFREAQMNLIVQEY